MMAAAAATAVPVSGGTRHGQSHGQPSTVTEAAGESESNERPDPGTEPWPASDSEPGLLRIRASGRLVTDGPPGAGRSAGS